jgi:outer membrane protein assembly factor BamB/TolA-binding protein
MSISLRSAALVFVSMEALTLWGAAPLRAQERAQGPTKTSTEETTPSLRANPTLVRKLDTARRCLAAEAWPEASHTLQALLDGAEDALVAVRRVGTDGKEIVRWTGVRGEAARLLGALPPAGRKFYREAYEPQAQALLVAARVKRDARRVAEVVRRYPHTAAGAEAAGLLALHHLDRAHDTLAALSFARLLERHDADRLPPATLFHAALAFRRAGDADHAERTWRELAARAPTGFRVRDRELSLGDLRGEFERVAVPDPTRPAERPPGPGLEPRWMRPTAHEAQTREWVQTAGDKQEIRDRPVVPAFFPVLVGDRLFYRSYRGLHAVDVRTGREAWEASSAWSIDRMSAHPEHGVYLKAWVRTHLELSPHVLFGNSLLGTLSTDGARLYAVEDLGVPPYLNTFHPRARWRMEMTESDLGPELAEAASCNRLLALDAATGRAVWQAGGPGPAAGPLGASYFLGPPLVLEGRLYVLAEKDGEVVLLCLGTDGILQGRLALAFVPTRMLLDPGRRLQAARPVHADGILVCPTNAGVVVGVDLLGLGLAWAYPYRTQPLTRAEVSEDRRRRVIGARLTAEWQVPVIIAGQGRVIFTAADEPSVHCLSLRDGAPLWRVGRQEEDLYLAGVFGGRVLLVGKRTCRALNLADGKQVWELETGLPSGLGTACGNLYYLPLKETDGEKGEKGAAVYAIDVRKGAIVARIPMSGKEVPGNLLLWSGEVLSQTAAGMTAYAGKKEGDK